MWPKRAQKKNQHQEPHERESIHKFVIFAKLVRQKSQYYIEWAKYIYVCKWDVLKEFLSFPWWLKNVKSRSKYTFSWMSAILKSDFQKRKQVHFSEENDLNYTKRHNFACDNYIFAKTRVNKCKGRTIWYRGGGWKFFEKKNHLMFTDQWD